MERESFGIIGEWATEDRLKDNRIDTYQCPGCKARLNVTATSADKFGPPSACECGNVALWDKIQ